MSIITQQLSDYCNQITSYDAKRSNGYGWLTRFCKDRVGLPLVSNFEVELKKLTSKTNVTGVHRFINKVLRLNKDLEDDVRTALEECSVIALGYSKTLKYEEEDLRLCSEEQFKQMNSNQVGAASGLAKLYFAGLRNLDLKAEANRLGKLKDGILEIKGESPFGRTLTDANRWGLTLEEIEEILPILQDLVLSAGSSTSELKDNLDPFTNGWEFTPTQLRTSHAVIQINSGLTLEEVAHLQGVRKSSLQQRVKKYLKAQ